MLLKDRASKPKACQNRHCDEITLIQIKSYFRFTVGAAVGLLFVCLLACLFSEEVLLLIKNVFVCFLYLCVASNDRQRIVSFICIIRFFTFPN